MSEKPTRWEYATTIIVLALAAAWVVNDLQKEPDKFPFEPLLAVVSYLILLIGYMRWKEKRPEATQSIENQRAEKIYNVEKIKNANVSIIVKGGLSFLLIGMLAIGLWQKDALKASLGFDRFFKEQTEAFKILVLPFKQICVQGGKNYDAGYILFERLGEISNKENLNIDLKYWDNYDFVDFSDQKARELQQYHHADMIIYGVYETSDCSAEGDQICLNYVTDEKWNLGTVGTDIGKDYQKGGLDDLKKGKLQEKIENIALFISILAQTKSLDHAAYLKKLQELLIEPDFNTSSKADVYIELADVLVAEGKLEEPLHYFEKALQIYEKNGDRGGQGACLDRLGSTHSSMGNLEKALGFFEQYNQLEIGLYEAYPQNVAFKNGLAISYSSLGDTHMDLGNLEKALHFFEQYYQLEKELFDAYPQNVSFKNSLAISYSQLGRFYRDQKGDKTKAKQYLEQCLILWKELSESYPAYVEYKKNYTWAENALKGL